MQKISEHKIVASQCIEGFEDYMIYSSGKVFSFLSGIYLNPYLNNKGYPMVCLRRDGKTHKKLVSRLVGQAFILNPENKPQINHMDGNPSNNNVTNLEWVTSGENLLHAYRTGLRKWSEKCGKPKIPVEVYDYDTGLYKSTHYSMAEAARVYGIHYQNINAFFSGKLKHVKRLTFKKI